MKINKAVVQYACATLGMLLVVVASLLTPRILCAFGDQAYINAVYHVSNSSQLGEQKPVMEERIAFYNQDTRRWPDITISEQRLPQEDEIKRKQVVDALQGQVELMIALHALPVEQLEIQQAANLTFTVLESEQKEQEMGYWRVTATNQAPVDYQVCLDAVGAKIYDIQLNGLVSLANLTEKEIKAKMLQMANGYAQYLEIDSVTESDPWKNGDHLIGYYPCASGHYRIRVECTVDGRCVRIAAETT